MADADWAAQLQAADPAAQRRALRALMHECPTDPTLHTLLVALLRSRAVASRDPAWSNALHEPIAELAAEALRVCRVTSDELVDALHAILDAGPPLNWHYPQASFDQGMYIGEYHSDEVKPTELACRLIRQLVSARPDTRSRFQEALTRALPHGDVTTQRAITATLAWLATG